MSKLNLSTSSSKEVRIFIFKLFVMLGIVAGFLLYLPPRYLENYNASLLDKVARLESISEPKIVLLGNSNLAFGIRSEEIEEAFGMPVVNMGLHGGLGNVFHERMAELNVCPGDIYVLCHTSFSDDGTIRPEETDLMWITLENHFELWKLLRRDDYGVMIKAYPAYLKKCIGLWLSGSGNQPDGSVYSRTAFNEYGDIVWEDQGLEYEYREGDIVVPGISDNVVLRLNELNAYLNERGARMVIAGYPIADTPYTPAPELYEEFGKTLAEKLDAAVISDYRDYIYPESDFYNAVFHLNNNGKEKRTRQLISDLEEYLKEEQKEIGQQDL